MNRDELLCVARELLLEHELTHMRWMEKGENLARFGIALGRHHLIDELRDELISQCDSASDRHHEVLHELLDLICIGLEARNIRAMTGGKDD